MELLQPDDRVVAYVGPTGYGKSTLLAATTSDDVRVIRLLEEDKDPGPGWIWFRDWPTFWRTMDNVNPRTFRVAFYPGQTYFPHVCALVKYFAPVTFLIDEMGKYFGPDIYYPDAATQRNVAIPREFVELCERGRHMGPQPDSDEPVSLRIGSQDATRIPRCARHELRRIFAFCLPTPEERRWLAGAPRCSKDIAEQTKDLGLFEYLNINTVTGGVNREKTTA